jgi:hypothetical protein
MNGEDRRRWIYCQYPLKMWYNQSDFSALVVTNLCLIMPKLIEGQKQFVVPNDVKTGK